MLIFPKIEIELGDKKFLLSLQASAMHYCSPKSNWPRLADYRDVEVAVYKDPPELLHQEELQKAGFPAFLVEASGGSICTYVPVFLLESWRKDIADHIESAKRS